MAPRLQDDGPSADPHRDAREALRDSEECGAEVRLHRERSGPPGRVYLLSRLLQGPDQEVRLRHPGVQPRQEQQMQVLRLQDADCRSLEQIVQGRQVHPCHQLIRSFSSTNFSASMRALTPSPAAVTACLYL